MRKEQEALLHILSQAVSGKKTAEPALDSKEWQLLIKLAVEHEILPIVYDSVYESGALKEVQKEERKKWQERALSVSIRQIIQTKEFLTLLIHAQKAGMDPVVVKGIVCRSLYLKPCLRPSVDEDILIFPEETERYHDFFLAEGLFPDNEEYTFGDREASPELSYHKKESPIYIELHKYLFAPESEIFGSFNELFVDALSRTVRVQIEDVSVRTLAPTDHLLFLVLHAYKHFLYSGIGIRPLCDIGLYAETYALQIDWDEMRRRLESVSAFYFAKALFRIIQLYLLPDGKFFSHIRDWDISVVDVDALLRDCLEGGLHGASSLSRLHSSNMTLQAAGSGAKSGGDFHALRRSLFPPVEGLRERYIYLKKAPFLLPLAWSHRMLCYFIETRKKDGKSKTNNNAAESIRLGRERIRLLRQYRIIK